MKILGTFELLVASIAIIAANSREDQTTQTPLFEAFAANIKEIGLLQPILVRPSGCTIDEFLDKYETELDSFKFEGNYGKRRLAAHRHNGMERIRAQIALVDIENKEDLAEWVAAIEAENNHRKPLNILEVAESIKIQRRLETSYYKISRQLGISSYKAKLIDELPDRMKNPEWHEAIRASKIGDEEAILVSRMDTDMQDRLLKPSFENGERIWIDGKFALSQVRLIKLLEDSTMRLDDVPWALEENIGAMAPCIGCQWHQPKPTAVSLFPELETDCATCSNSSCYNIKLLAAGERMVEKVAKDGGWKLDTEYKPSYQLVKEGSRRVNDGDECEHTTVRMEIAASNRSKSIKVSKWCGDVDCAKHFGKPTKPERQVQPKEIDSTEPPKVKRPRPETDGQKAMRKATEFGLQVEGKIKAEALPKIEECFIDAVKKLPTLAAKDAESFSVLIALMAKNIQLIQYVIEKLHPFLLPKSSASDAESMSYNLACNLIGLRDPEKGEKEAFKDLCFYLPVNGNKVIALIAWQMSIEHETAFNIARYYASHKAIDGIISAISIRLKGEHQRMLGDSQSLLDDENQVEDRVRKMWATPTNAKGLTIEERLVGYCIHNPKEERYLLPADALKLGYGADEPLITAVYDAWGIEPKKSLLNWDRLITEIEKVKSNYIEWFDLVS